LLNRLDNHERVGLSDVLLPDRVAASAHAEAMPLCRPAPEPLSDIQQNLVLGLTAAALCRAISSTRVGSAGMGSVVSAQWATAFSQRPRRSMVGEATDGLNDRGQAPGGGGGAHVSTVTSQMSR
jgi:hypothetical protein